MPETSLLDKPLMTILPDDFQSVPKHVKLEPVVRGSRPNEDHRTDFEKLLDEHTVSNPEADSTPTEVSKLFLLRKGIGKTVDATVTLAAAGLGLAGVARMDPSLPVAAAIAVGFYEGGKKVGNILQNRKGSA